MNSWERSTGFAIRVLAAAFLALIVLGSWQLFARGAGTGDGAILGLFSWKWALGLLMYSVAAIGMLLASVWGLARPRELALQILPDQEARSEALPWCGWLLAGLLVLVPSGFLLGPWGWRFAQPFFRLLLVLACGLASGLFVPQRSNRIVWLVLGPLLAASILILASRLMAVSDYPFSLGWSEGNRIWDYSLYFGRERYDVVGAFQYPTYLTPGRHGLWGLPFLFYPGISLAGMRFWDVLQWVVPYVLFGMALFSRRRLKRSGLWRLALVLWVFLFISQGPIYAPLVLSAALVAAGYRRDKPWRTLLFTMVAAFYSGISRWTWLFAPAIWVAVWRFLDEETDLPLFARIKWPFAFGVAGMLGGALSLQTMSMAFPRPDPIYSTSMSQDLLWYRLWPSETNPTGIVWGALLAFGPLILWLLWRMLQHDVRWDWLQAAAVFGSLGAFLAAGLVASVKIGGGNNLHNLDMFIMGLVCTSAWLLMRFGVGSKLRSISIILMAVSVCIPLWFAAQTEAPPQLPDAQVVQENLEFMRQVVGEALEEGQVLFIDQRQLLTFGEIEDVPLVMDYELKHLMNQAMGHNRPYLEKFTKDLADHRFSLIVSDPLPIVYKKGEGPFPEENDAWVAEVTLPILEYYEPIADLPGVDVWLLAPKGSEG